MEHGLSLSGRANLHPRCNPLDRQRWECPPGGPHHSSCNRSRQDIPPAWRAAWGHAGRDTRPRASKENNRETAEFHRGTHFTPKAQLHGGRGKVLTSLPHSGKPVDCAVQKVPCRAQDFDWVSVQVLSARMSPVGKHET